MWILLCIFSFAAPKQSLLQNAVPLGDVIIEPFAPTAGARLSSGGVHARMIDLSGQFLGHETDEALVEVQFDQESQWYAEATIDMGIMPEKARFRALIGHNILTDMSNWDQVTPLESLAAQARLYGVPTFRVQTQDVLDFMRRGACELPVLKLKAMPLQVSGTHKARVRLVSMDRRLNLVQAAVWNPDSQRFEMDQTVPLYISAGGNENLSGTPLFDPSHLVLSDFNKEGYIISVHQDLPGDVQAILPVDLLKTAPTVQPIQRATQDSWNLVAEMRQVPNQRLSNLQRRGTARVQRLKYVDADDVFEGETPDGGVTHLVMHVFGSNSAYRERASLGIAPGHFSLGLAQAKSTPLAKEPLWQIEYAQVYAHNLMGIASTRVDQLTYAGGVRQGRGFDVPFQDTLIPLPQIAESHFDQLLENLDFKMAMFRIGDGSGLTDVSAVSSCVYDSIEALAFWARQLSSTDPQNDNLSLLLDMAKATGGRLPKQLHVPFHVRAESHLLPGAGFVGHLIRSFRSLFPRSVEHRILRTLVANNHGFYQLRSAGLVLTPDYFPAPPNSLLHYWDRTNASYLRRVWNTYKCEMLLGQKPD